VGLRNGGSVGERKIILEHGEEVLAMRDEPNSHLFIKMSRWENIQLKPIQIAILMDNVNTSIQSFNERGVYPCPACRLGQIQVLYLMDAMACNACQHIFTVNPERQRLSTVDFSPPMTWHWNGRNWTGAHVENMRLGWSYYLIAIAFVALPPSLIGFSAYYVWVRNAGASLPLLPIVWMGLTFLLHLSLIGLSVIGFYRFSVGTYFRVMGRNLLNR
jgi:hypothetical protein